MTRHTAPAPPAHRAGRPAASPPLQTDRQTDRQTAKTEKDDRHTKRDIRPHSILRTMMITATAATIQERSLHHSQVAYKSGRRGTLPLWHSVWWADRQRTEVPTTDAQTQQASALPRLCVCVCKREQTQQTAHISTQEMSSLVCKIIVHMCVPCSAKPAVAFAPRVVALLTEDMFRESKTSPPARTNSWRSVSANDSEIEY